MLLPPPTDGHECFSSVSQGRGRANPSWRPAEFDGLERWATEVLLSLRGGASCLVCTDSTRRDLKVSPRAFHKTHGWSSHFDRDCVSQLESRTVKTSMVSTVTTLLSEAPVFISKTPYSDIILSLNRKLISRSLEADHKDTFILCGRTFQSFFFL